MFVTHNIVALDEFGTLRTLNGPLSINVRFGKKMETCERRILVMTCVTHITLQYPFYEFLEYEYES